MDIRKQLCQKVLERKDDMVKLCVDMVRIPSETPPSDTREVADFVHSYLKDIPGVELSFHTEEEPVKNLVALLKGRGPGKRLIFNGHLDTYPAGDVAAWDDSPWSGLIKDGFIYGRGSSDMKGGIACFITAFKILAEHRDAWNGEIALTLAGDEEAMGSRGTRYLLDTVPVASGDAMICADVGAPNSLRFGQKGFLWFSLSAQGKSAHGAHLHKGVNAINRLIQVIDRINEEVPKLPVNAPDQVTKAILAGAEISEKGAGPGETEILQQITVNVGTISGGISPNLVPSSAKAEGDIRIPAGVTLAQIKEKLNEIVGRVEGTSYTIIQSCEPNWSDPEDRLFGVVKKNSEEVLNEEVVVTYRVGASDSRIYRTHKNITSINCGLTPYGLGGPNEHVSIEEMVKIAQIHVLSALDYLA